MRNACSLLATVVCLTLSTGACGAKVNFVGEEGGAGAGSSSGGETSSGGASSSGGGTVTSCDSLLASYQGALAAATACNPALNSIQCDGTAVGTDTCGCPSVLLNERNPDLVATAQKAYEAWVGAGCGPYDCGEACLPASAGGCVPDATGTSGTCQVFLPE